VTLPRHASRRVTELVHAEATLRSLGCNAGIVRESRRLTQEIADAVLASALPGSEAPGQLAALVESLRVARFRGDRAGMPVWGAAEERGS